jgi:hypothetical protein
VQHPVGPAKGRGGQGQRAQQVEPDRLGITMRRMVLGRRHHEERPTTGLVTTG